MPRSPSARYDRPRRNSRRPTSRRHNGRCRRRSTGRSQPADRPSSSRLARLCEIFDGAASPSVSTGTAQVVLARPDSWSRPAGDRERAAISLAGYVAELTTRRRRSGSPRRRRTAVRLRHGSPCRTRSADRSTRSALVGANAAPRPMVDRLRADRRIAAELNHVLIGAQVVIGDPLGAHARLGRRDGVPRRRHQTTTGASRRCCRLREPADQPRFLARAAISPTGGARSVLVLDTGLRTVEGGRRAGRARGAQSTASCTRRGSATRRWAPRTTRTSTTTTAPACSTSRPGTARSSPASSARSAPTPTSTVRRRVCRASARATRLRSSTPSAAASTPVEQPFDIVVMSFGAFFAERRSRDVRRLARRAARRRLRRRRGGQSAHLPAVLPGGPARTSSGRRTRRRRHRRGSPTSAAGSTPAPRRSTWSARSSTTSPRPSTASSTRRYRGAGRGGVGRASPRRRSPARSPRRCIYVR